MTINFKDTSAYFTEADKKSLARRPGWEATLKRLYAELAVVNAAIANNENPDPYPEARIETLIATGINTPPPKTFEEQAHELQNAIRDINEALDKLAVTEKQIRWLAGQKLNAEIRPQATALEKRLVEAAVALHEVHFEYWTHKRHLINEGIGLFGNFSNSIDEILGVPVDGGSQFAEFFREAIKSGHLRSLPKAFRS